MPAAENGTTIFTGRTGAAIALEAHRRGHTVTLLTSHPETAAALVGAPRWRCVTYGTFAELSCALEFGVTTVSDGIIRSGPEKGVRTSDSTSKQDPPDVLIHSAAVSDYLVNGVYTPAAGTHFNAHELVWYGGPPTFIDRTGVAKTAAVTVAEDPHVDVVAAEPTEAQKAFRDRWLGARQ